MRLALQAGDSLFGGFFNRNVLAIETGHRAIRICHSSRGMRVSGSVSLEAPVDDGMITDAEAFAEIIGGYVSAHGLKGCAALVTVRTEKAVIRRVKLPVLKRKDIDGWINCNISEIFPAGIDNYVYSYRTAAESPSAASLYIMLLPAEISDGYAEILAGLGLTPKLVDIFQNSLSLGMARLVRGSGIALADISEGRLGLVLRGPELDGIYHVECGGAKREHSMLKAHIPASARFERGFLLSGRPWALEIFNELIRDGVIDNSTSGWGSVGESLAITGLLAAGAGGRT